MRDPMEETAVARIQQDLPASEGLPQIRSEFSNVKEAACPGAPKLKSFFFPSSKLCSKFQKFSEQQLLLPGTRLKRKNCFHPLPISITTYV